MINKISELMKIPAITVMDIVRIGNECGYQVDEVDNKNGYVLFKPENRFYRTFFTAEKSTLYMQDYYCDDTDLTNRLDFDGHYHKLKSELFNLLGQECGNIKYVPKHRNKTHYYNASYWDFNIGYVILAQDEFDIQMGLDVSIRIFWGRGQITDIIENFGSA